jgi:hypothetical protein
VKRATVSLLLLLSINAVAQDSSKPRISPFFDRIDEGSAFFVECRNTTGETVSAARILGCFFQKPCGIFSPVQPTRSGATTRGTPQARHCPFTT